jgi:hypothetical protein
MRYFKLITYVGIKEIMVAMTYNTLPFNNFMYIQKSKKPTESNYIEKVPIEVFDGHFGAIIQIKAEHDPIGILYVLISKGYFVGINKNSYENIAASCLIGKSYSNAINLYLNQTVVGKLQLLLLFR